MDRREGPGPAGADPFSLLALLAAFALLAAVRVGRGVRVACGGRDGLFAGRGGWFGVVHALVPGDGRLTRFGRGRREPLAGDAFFRVGGLRAVRRAAGRGAQEPARRRGHAGQVIVVARRLGLRWRDIGPLSNRGCGLRRDQAGRHRPGRRDLVRPGPARGARMLRFFGRSGFLMTILTRSITFCAHHKPQFSHFSDEMSRSSPFPTDSYGSSRASMLPIESESVQRAIFWTCRDHLPRCR